MQDIAKMVQMGECNRVIRQALHKTEVDHMQVKFFDQYKPEFQQRLQKRWKSVYCDTSDMQYIFDFREMEKHVFSQRITTKRTPSVYANYEFTFTNNGYRMSNVKCIKSKLCFKDNLCIEREMPDVTNSWLDVYAEDDYMMMRTPGRHLFLFENYGAE